MSNLIYHATGETEEGVPTLDDLIPGHDGLVHFHDGQNNTLIDTWPVQVPACLDVDLEALPTLADLGGWTPYAMAQACRDNGLLPAAKVNALLAAHPLTEAQQGFHAGLAASRLEEHLRYEERPSGLDLETLLDEAIDEAAEAEDTELIDKFDAEQQDYQACLALRYHLFEALADAGIKAFRYRNLFERARQPSWSVAVLDTDCLSPAPTPGPGPAPARDGESPPCP